jgi:hypothetical protein
LLEPLDLQLITPEIKRRNRLAHETTFAHSAIRGSRWPFAAADRCLIKLERHAPKCPYPGQGRCRPRVAMCQAALSRTRRQFRVGRQSSDCAQSGSPI